MSKYKIVFSDIDGTFIRKDHTLSEKHALAAKKLIEQKIPFVLVSARMPEGIYPITNQIGIKIPIISYSGGLVLTADEKILYSKTIDENSARDMIEAIENIEPELRKRVSPNFYAGRKWYVNSIDERVQVEINTTKASVEIVPDFRKLLDKKILPNKLLLLGDDESCAILEKDLGGKFPNLHVVRSSSHILDIMEKTVSKATGIKVMLEHFGLTVEDALAFGDNYNDREMLQLVGHSVVMDNAPDEIKQLADEVTDSNENDGVYTFLVKNNIISE